MNSLLVNCKLYQNTLITVTGNNVMIYSVGHYGLSIEASETEIPGFVNLCAEIVTANVFLTSPLTIAPICLSPNEKIILHDTHKHYLFASTSIHVVWRLQRTLPLVKL